MCVNTKAVGPRTCMLTSFVYLIAETVHKAMSMKSIRQYRCDMLLWSATNAAFLRTCMCDIHKITSCEFFANTK